MSVLTKLKALRETASTATREATAGVEEIREQRLTILREKDRIEGMPLPGEISLAALERDLDRIDANARRDFFGSSLTHSKAPRLAPMRPEVMLGLLVGACREQFRAAIVQEIAPHFEAGAEMTLPEREARLAKIADELDELERAEEALIREAEANGLPILRRADANADTLLLADSALGL